MILQALCQYYQRMRDNADIDIAEPGFSSEKIHAEIVLDEDGGLLQFNDLRVEGGKKPVPRKLTVPQSCKRTGSKPYEKPFFLWDNTGFVLGKDARNDEKTPLKHQYFKQLHYDLLSDCTVPGAQALLKFLNRWSPEEAQKLDNWDELVGGNVIFRLDGQRRYLHDNEALKRIWQRHLENQQEAFEGHCLVTGRIAPIARIHPAVKGVAKAQSSGAALISFNDEAYESYGKKQNYNAPVDERMAFAYTTALNQLLAGNSSQKIAIGDTTAIFWTERDSPVEGMLGMVLDPNEAEITDNADLRHFLEAVRQGRRPQEIDPEVTFYILGLSPNAARLAVRFWHVCSVGELEDRIGQHFRDLQLQRSFDFDPEYPGIRRILRETYNKKSKTETASPLLAGALLRCILEGTPYPQALQNAVINRIRAEQSLKDKNGRPIENVNYVRAAILKAILVRKHRIYNQGMEVKMSLDTENKNQAYLLGRLFAVLEKVQQEAVPGAGATIRDRFWGATSATPRMVFPHLLSLKNHHVSKIQTDNPHRALFFEKLFGEIIDNIGSSGFPAHLTMDQQGLFCIGYYHQRQDLFKKKENQN